MSAAQNKSKMECLVKKREKYFARLQALYDVGKKCIDLAIKKQPYSNELESFLCRFQRIEDDYARYEQTCDEMNMLNLSLEEEDKIEVHNASMAYDEIYFNVKSQARKLKVDQHLPQSPQGTTPPHPQSSGPQVARLPKLEIEPFDGSISSWPNFYALFNSLIHKNTSLSKCEKLTYLRSLLKSHALSLIETLVISEENYDIAMDLLIQRYQNRRLLASNYLNKVFSFRPLTEDSVSSLTNYLEVFNTNISALKALNISDLFDLTLLHVGLRNLPPSIHKDFENEHANTEIPTFETLIKFVEQQLKVLEITSTKGKPKPFKPYPSTKAFNQRSSMLSTTNGVECNSIKNKPILQCPCCQDIAHKIYACSKFKTLNLLQRNDVVRQNSLCYCCLGFHRLADCKSTSRCFTCKGKHHSLLHRSKESTPISASPHTPSDANHSSDSALAQNVSTKTCGFTNSTSNSSVLLSTAVVGVRDRWGNLQPIKALLDGGSQTSLVTEKCANKLGLQRQSSNITLSAITGSSIPFNKEHITVNISPLHNCDISLTTDAIIVPTISSDQPNFQIDKTLRSKFSHLRLADPTFEETSPIEFLIGTDLYFDILQDSHSLIKGEPSAIATIFGWVIGGKIPDPSPSDEISSLLTCCGTVDASIKRFWEVESMSVAIKPSPDDEATELHFQENHQRDESGRYIVALPIKPNAPALPDTTVPARRQLVNLESRLKRNPEVYEEYRAFMNDYIDQGHMTLSKTPSNFIIPHHCVHKQDSSTTKLRTVFNASFKIDDSSSSLNDILYSGPKLQRDISEVITHFRLHKIVVCADIKQMYRNVLVAENHRKLQHIFYRTEPEGQIDEYELNVLTYGVTSSAFLAQRVLLQLVEDEGKTYPLASRAITEQTFVDDICTSVDTPQEALHLQKELIDILNRGGFSLRKWASNCPLILDQVPLDHREKPLNINSKDDHSLKVLGIQYNPNDDTFSYSINLNKVVYTKRFMLSEMSKIYDILGWITPATFLVKHLMQTTWILGLDWDDPLPNEVHSKWSTFISTLPELSRLKIPRYVPTSSASMVQIIGFCDASEKGYAANLYLRSEHEDSIGVHLVKAKSKVAPLKVMSIPRLELAAAQLLMQLLVSVRSLIESLQLKNIILYSDSSVVLSWLKIPPYKLKTFVANRVVDIMENTSPDQWHHVKSEKNPCDVASRGLLPKDLVHCDLWWNGPDFLHTPFSVWKQGLRPTEIQENVPEVRVESLMINQQYENSIILEILENSSSLTKAKAVIAFLLRFISNCQTKKRQISQNKGPLTPQELQESLELCIKATQQCLLSKDINSLKNSQLCSTKYRSLAPFLDGKDFLRVGGRLKFSNLPFSAKHPVLIPRSSRLASLICDYYHLLSLHGGIRLTQSLIQRRYWIVGIRQLLRERIFRCHKCYLFQAKPFVPKMADLPPVRFERLRAFLNIGLDYAGPFEYKEGMRRKALISKGYIAIFVCLATKAVHIEFVTSLSTPVFLAAFDRFVARRGLCQKIYSDCGTNFRGASNHYAEVQRFLKENNKDIAHQLSLKEIKWIFNPPAAPHFGGIWEAAVKSTKYHLSRIVGNLKLTYEEITTILYRIEAILNSRPLGSLTSDPNDGDYLTPGHFIVGSPLITPPEVDYTETRINRLTRYQLLQQASQAFWKSWSQDYLHTLMPRNKWTTSQPNVQKGDIVYLQMKNTNPMEWPLGRVEDTYPGQDGIIRAVKIKTPQGIFVRPVHKLTPLPPPDLNLKIK